jgi:hypothetical protein
MALRDSVIEHRWRFVSHRWGLWRPRWWRPTIERHKRLAAGPYQGWHLWWGPLHAWDVLTHNRTREKGFGWR